MLDSAHNRLSRRYYRYNRWHSHPRRHIHHQRIAYTTGIAGLAGIGVSLVKFLLALSLLASLSIRPELTFAASQNWTSQADWNTWTLSNTTATDNPGSVQLSASGTSGSWSTSTASTAGGSVVGGSADNDIWLFNTADTSNRFFGHLVNGSWTERDMGDSVEVWGVKAVAGTSSTDAWAVGTGGHIAHYVTATWNDVTSPTVNDLNAIKIISPTSIYAAGASGTIIHYNGTVWSTVATGLGSHINTATLNAIDATSDSNVWVVGTNVPAFESGVFYYNGSSWNQAASGAWFDTGVVATASYAYVLNHEGYAATVLYKFDLSGNFVSDMALPVGDTSNINHAGIAGSSDSDLWVLIDHGSGTDDYEHWNGSSWSSTTPSIATPTAIWGNGSKFAILNGVSTVEIYTVAGTVYQASGTATITYTPSAGQKNDWTTATPTTTTPTNTTATIEYSHDNSTWVSSLASVPSSESLYVRASLATSDTSVTPTLDALTVNYDAITTTVSSPNGGETIRFNETGDTTPITWTAAGTSGVDHIHLQYSSNSGGAWSDISGATSLAANTTSYDWNMPDSSSSTVRIKVILENSSNAELASDTSNADFTLTYDTTNPTFSSVSASSNNSNTAIAKSGNIVTVTFTASEALTANPTVTLGGQAMTYSSSVGLDYTYTRTVNGTETESATSPIAISGTDLAGNAGTGSGSFALDFTSPTIAVTSPSSGGSYATIENSLLISGTSADGTAVSTVTSSAAGSVTGTTSWSQTVSLAIGVTTITYTATDTAGNTATDSIEITRSGVAPVINITGPSEETTYSTNQTSVTFSGTAAAAVGTVSSVTSSEGGVVTGTTSWSQTLTLPVGTTTVTYTVTDSDSQTSTDSITVTVDQSSPTIAVSSPVGGGGTYYTTASSVAVSGTATDNIGVSSVTSSVAGTVTGTTSWSQTVSLSAGSNSITYTSHDAAGNTATATITIISDPTAPTITVSSPVADGGTYYTTLTSLTVSGTAADNIGVSSVTSSVAGTVTGTTSWSQPVTLSAGSNSITYTSHDAAGNTATATITIISDSAAPTITVSSPVADGGTYYTTLTSLTVSGTAADNIGVSSVTSSVAGTVTGTTSWSQPVTLTAGSNSITYTSHDATGNTATATITIISDPTAPTITVSSPVADGGTYYTTASSIAVSGTAADNIGVSSVTSSASGTVTGTTSWSQTVSLSAGSNSITYTSHDAAGNTATATITVVRDSTAPTITVSSPVGDGETYYTTGSSIAVSGTAADNIGVSSVTSSASGTVTGTTSWSQTVTLSAGSNSITYTSHDATGNTATATITIISDPTAPTITVSSPVGDGGTYYTSASSLAVSGTAADNIGVSSVTSSASGTVTGTTSWSQTVTISEGSNSITYTSHDAAGNTASATITVVRDSTAPVITISSPGSSGSTNYSTQNPVTVSGTSSDNVSVATVTSSASGTVTGTTSWSQTTTLNAGSNSITYTATDTSGNTATATITIYPDSTAPTITVSSPTSNGGTYSTKESSLTISGVAADNLSLTSVTSSASGTVTGTTSWSQTVTLSAGSNSITFTASDAAGNTTTTTVTIYLDVIAPTISITSPTNTATYSTDQSVITLAGISADNLSSPDITSSYGSTVTGSESWSQEVTLNEGSNTLTYTATDRVGNTATDSIVITYVPSTPSPTPTPTPTPTRPEPVQNLQLYIGTASITLTYSPLPTGHSVTIWRSTNSTDRGTELTATTEQQYTDQSVTPGQAYYYTLIVKRSSDGMESLPASGTATISTRYGLSVKIAPLIVSVKPGATAQLQATVRDTLGNSVPTPVMWSVDPAAGTISSTGLFTAGSTPGDFRQGIHARVDYQGLQGNDAIPVYVDATDEVVSYVYLTPTSDTLKPGQRSQYRLAAYNQNGAGYAIDQNAITWSATTGTITNRGLYTAGTKEATFINAITATYTDKQGQRWKASAHVTISSAPRLLTFANLSGNLRIPVGTVARYYSYGFDQFSNIMPTQSRLFSNNNPDAGSIDSGGLFHADNQESCFFYNLRADQEAGGVHRYARSGVNTLRRTDAELVALDTASNFSFRQYAFLHKPGASFSFIANVVNGWGQIRPHTTTRFKILDSRAGTITPNGQFVAGNIPGIYPASFGAYMVNTTTNEEKLYYRYTLVISPDDPYPTRVVTPGFATAPNLVGQTSVYVYDQFGISYSLPLVRRYTLLGGNSTIQQNGQVETTTPEDSRHVIFGSINVGGLSTITANQGSITVAQRYAPKCGTSLPNTPPWSGDGGGGDGGGGDGGGPGEFIDDDGNPLYFITPENAVLPGSPASAIEPVIPANGVVPTILSTHSIPGTIAAIGHWIAQHVPWLQAVAIPLSALAIIASLPALAVGLVDIFSQLFGRLFSGLANLLQALTVYRRPRSVGKVQKGSTRLPVVAATVTLLTPGTRRVVETQRTDSNGQYVALVDQRQAYLLQVTAEGFAPYERVVRGYAIHRLIRLGANLENDPGRLIQRQRWEKILNLLTKSRIVLLVVGTLAWVTILFDVGGIWQSYALGVYYLLAWTLEWYISILPRPYGIVSDAVTRAPLHQVVVRIINGKGRVVVTQITNTNGRFRTLLPAGSYTFTYAKAGYEPTTRTGIILNRGNRSFHVDASLQPKRSAPAPLPPPLPDPLPPEPQPYPASYPQ